MWLRCSCNVTARQIAQITMVIDQFHLQDLRNSTCEGCIRSLVIGKMLEALAVSPRVPYIQTVKVVAEQAV
jgi:hypothetical protein